MCLNYSYELLPQRRMIIKLVMRRLDWRNSEQCVSRDWKRQTGGQTEVHVHCHPPVVLCPCDFTGWPPGEMAPPITWPASSAWVSCWRGPTSITSEHVRHVNTQRSWAHYSASTPKNNISNAALEMLFFGVDAQYTLTFTLHWHYITNS